MSLAYWGVIGEGMVGGRMIGMRPERRVNIPAVKVPAPQLRGHRSGA